MQKKRKMLKTSKQSQLKLTRLAEKTEQILFSMPRIIVVQINKDLKLLKKQEIKFKHNLKKIERQQKKLLPQHNQLKKKNTQLARRQGKIIQQKIQKLVKLAETLSEAIEAISLQTLMLTKKKSKYEALQKQLIQFEKRWHKNASETVKKKRRSRKRPSHSEIVETPLASEEASHYPFQASVEEEVEINNAANEEGKES